MDRSAYEAMAQIDEAHWWYRARRTIIAHILAKVVKPASNAHIAEIGCGTGANLASLTGYGPISAVEPDDEARAYAAARSGATILKGHLPDGIPLAPASQDILVMLDVLEHLEDDVAALVALKRPLKDKGVLVLAVPAHQWLWSAHDEIHHHQRRYSPKTLRAAFAAAGWRIDRLTYFNSLLFPLVAGVRLWKNFRKDDSLDTDIPPAWLNRILEAVFAFERWFLGWCPMTMGVSILVIARPATKEAHVRQPEAQMFGLGARA